MDIKALIRYVEIDNNGNLTFRKKPKCEFNTMKVIILTTRHPLFGELYCSWRMDHSFSSITMNLGLS